MHEELLMIDRSINRWCHRTATAERVGPFVVFLEPDPFAARYARPVVGVQPTPADVVSLLHRQRELGLPAEIEAVAECHPGLADLLSLMGWDVVSAPLMVHRRSSGAPPRSGSDPTIVGLDIRRVGHDDPELSRVDSIGHLAFGHPGMTTGRSGVDEVRAAAASHDPASNRERLRLEHIVMLAAYLDGEAVAYGSLILDDQAPMAEIVAVGTLPAFRRRGIGSILTSALVDEAGHRGDTIVWLSAADTNVASLYARLGFDHIGTYLMASFPPT